MRYSRMAIYTALLSMLCAAPASALTVRNLDDAKHQVKIRSGNNLISMPILPGKQLHVTGRHITLQVDDGEPRNINDDYDYVIWNDGTLNIQRRNRHNSSRKY